MFTDVYFFNETTDVEAVSVQVQLDTAPPSNPGTWTSWGDPEVDLTSTESIEAQGYRHVTLVWPSSQRVTAWSVVIVGRGVISGVNSGIVYSVTGPQGQSDSIPIDAGASTLVLRLLDKAPNDVRYTYNVAYGLNPEATARRIKSGGNGNSGQ